MTITAAADGSALGNPGPCGWAWYIDDNSWAAGGSPHGTNNQGELQAVLELLKATAGAGDALHVMCDSKYVIDSITKWMPGWKRRGWRKADGGPVLNRDLMKALDAQMRGRDVTFSWVKGHAGHELNEAADERANAAAKAYQTKQEPNRGPGFRDRASAQKGSPPAASPASTPTHDAQPLWAEASSLFDAFDEPAASAITLTVTLSADEHARLQDRADAQGITPEDALRRLI